MLYTTIIDNVFCKKNNLNANQAIVLSWMIGAHSWSQYRIIEDKIFYFLSRNLAVDELLLVTDKPDTMYRHYKFLEKNGFIELKKIGTKDYVSITEKCGDWNKIKEFNSEILPNNPEKSEIIPSELSDSEINPEELGNSSESTRKFFRHISLLDNKLIRYNLLFPKNKFSDLSKVLQDKYLKTLKKEKEEKSSAKKEEKPAGSALAAKEKKPLEWPEMAGMNDIYTRFINYHTGAPAKFNAITGKKMKEIIIYLRTTVDDKENLAEDVVIIFTNILINHKHWEPFHQKQLKLEQIESNLINILASIKLNRNGQSGSNSKQDTRNPGSTISTSNYNPRNRASNT